MDRKGNGEKFDPKNYTITAREAVPGTVVWVEGWGSFKRVTVKRWAGNGTGYATLVGTDGINHGQFRSHDLLEEDSETVRGTKSTSRESAVARQTSSEGDVYVHATIRGYHPNNRYRVVDEHTVAERGWYTASGMWALSESDRQVCPAPFSSPCGCVVTQRDR
jgi:hypothetical protein